MKTLINTLIVSLIIFSAAIQFEVKAENTKDIVIDEREKTPFVNKEMVIDTVWAGHPVGFFLITEGERQYAAYYNADRQMVVASRLLGEDKWQKFMPQTDYKQPPSGNSPASATLGWDSHNYIKIALDSKGFIHLSGNMHVNNLTYFRSEKPYDITTLVQVKSMTGELEDKCTYPDFLKTADGKLIFAYRHGSSGNGNQIYNIYDTDTKKWSRLLDKPLTDGEGLRNAYIQGPLLGPDGWYHISWVWRETYDCSTNHDLSYAKSKNLLDWYTVDDKELKLPLTLETPGLIVDAIPEKGGIINGSGKIGFDNDGRVILSYHKFDKQGNTQAYCARAVNGRWQKKQLTDWDYRWYFEGGGSIKFEVGLDSVKPRNDEYMELSYRHEKYGSGTWLLDNRLNICGKVYKPQQIPSSINKLQSDFPGMSIKRTYDAGTEDNDQVTYLLSWETLGQNRDMPREGELPAPSELKFYEIRYKQDK